MALRFASLWCYLVAPLRSSGLTTDMTHRRARAALGSVLANLPRRMARICRKATVVMYGSASNFAPRHPSGRRRVVSTIDWYQSALMTMILPSGAGSRLEERVASGDNSAIFAVSRDLHR